MVHSFVACCSDAAQARVAMNLLRIQGRDNRWIALASEVYGLAACDIEDNVVLGGDNVLLAILIHVSRQTIHSYKEGMLELVKALTQFDIRHTLPGPQHDFCTLWNELVQEAKKQRSSRTPIHILRLIRRLYITFHQGTDAAPTSFSASTNSLDASLFEPSSYPLCDIASHRPDPTAPVPLPTQPAHSPDASSHHSTSGGNTDSQQVKEASNIEKPSSPRDPTIPSKIGDSSRAPAITSPALPVHTSPCPTDTLPPGAVATALKNIPLAAPFSRPLEGNAQQDILAPHVKPDISETMSTMSAPAPTIPASTQHVLNTSLTSCDAGAVSTSDPLLPASSVVCHSAPTSPPPSRVPPFPKTLSRPTDSTAPHRLRARRLVNSGNMSFADAVLHLLVLPLPFRDLFKELGGLKGRSETGRGATPLVDATVRFSKEFIFKDNEPSQQVAGGKPREDKEAKKEHNAVDSFKPTYMYDAMNEKRQLKKLLDGMHENAEEFLGLYLDALDEELVDLRTYISTHKPASAPSVKEIEEEVQSAEDQTEAGKQDYAASSVESPISRIFGGRSRSTVCAPSKPDTITTEAWRSLKLYIQPDSVHTIQDALAHLSQPQPVQVGQSSPSEASQQMLLEALPPVLILHLERFLYDTAADGIIKISKPIQFAPELEIPLEIMAPVSGKSAEAVHYKLFGVLYHHGESTGSGHYTVDVLHQNRNEEVWLHIDDESVKAVGHEDVFGGDDNERMDNQCTYMLFYCRTAPALGPGWTR
ncbi:hypothetical protein BJV77DRAFT_743795 [Russula vinacea]|nr:hypothetical protein BJV77DRAFT_743795 [Russula vinacea]